MSKKDSALIKKFLNELFNEFSEIRFAASSLAFSTLLSIIPFLIVVFVVLQSIGGLDELYPQIENATIGYLKEATGSTVSQYVRSSLNTFQNRTVGATGIFLLLWTSLGLIRNIDIAFHRIWKIKIRKPIYRRIWLYWLILMLVPMALALFTGLKSVNYFNQVSQNVEHQFLFSISSALFLWILYTSIPDTKISRLATLGPAIGASVILSVVQKSFLWFCLKTFKQNKIYGSLASFPIFLIWLLLVWYIVLSGVSMCSFIQRRIFKNT